MTRLQKAMNAASELREALNDLQAAPERDSAAIEAKAKEYRDAERELREAIKEESEASSTATPTVDAETRGRHELRGRAKAHRYVTAAATERPIDGAEAEYAAAEKCDGMMPVRMLFPPPAPAAETRAAATVAAGAVAENPMPTAGEVFVSPLAARLGVMTPMVPAGTAAFRTSRRAPRPRRWAKVPTSAIRRLPSARRRWTPAAWAQAFRCSVRTWRSSRTWTPR